MNDLKMKSQRSEEPKKKPTKKHPGFLAYSARIKAEIARDPDLFKKTLEKKRQAQAK